MFSTGFAFLKNVTASGGGYDPDAEAYFTQVLAVGGSLTIPEKDAVNQLTLDFKAAGIYSKFDIFLPILGNTAASSKINLVEPSNATYDWDYVGTPVFSATGIKGNGTDAAVRSLWKVDDLVKSQPGDAHWSSYQKYYSSSTGNLNGGFDIGGTFFIHGMGNGQNTGFGSTSVNGIYCGLIYSGGQAAMDGFMYIEAETSSLAKSYLQNSIMQTDTTAQSQLSANCGQALLACYFNGETNNIYPYFNPNEARSFSVGSYLDSAERTAYYNAITTYQTTLGRNV
jgi:hypothetical protein